MQYLRGRSKAVSFSVIQNGKHLTLSSDKVQAASWCVMLLAGMRVFMCTDTIAAAFG